MKLISAKSMLRALGAVAAFVLATQTALSSGNVKIESSENGKVTIALEDVQTRKVSLSIESDDQTKVFYSTKVSANQDLKKAFDLSNLEDGDYLLIAKYENTTLKKEFTMKDAEIVKETETEGIYYKPVFKNTESGLVVLFQSPSKEEISVSFKAENNTFFTHNAENSKLAANYNLTTLPSGAYEVVLTAGEYKYSYDVHVD
ncbi:MAG: hypothetical protein MI922_14135 [Bacteroidales bacterium]|nr:hypothetical protein [Bacteroidales bacterium]